MGHGAVDALSGGAGVPLAKLAIPRAAWLAMQQEVQARLPEEACGALLGRNGQAQQAVAVTNMLHSPVRFRMEPREQVRLFQRMEAEGLELLAVYHSHPAGPPTPSPTDTAEAYYPGVVQLVWSQAAGGWICRGFLIQDGQYEEVELLQGQ